MGDVTQIFLENPLPTQFGEGANDEAGPSHSRINDVPESLQGNEVSGPSHGFWTRLPVEGPSNVSITFIDHLVKLPKKV